MNYVVTQSFQEHTPFGPAKAVVYIPHHTQCWVWNGVGMGAYNAYLGEDVSSVNGFHLQAINGVG